MAKRKIRTGGGNSRRIGGGNATSVGANEDRFVLPADISRQANSVMGATSNLRRISIGQESTIGESAIEGNASDKAIPAKTEGPKLTKKKKKKKKKGKVVRIKTKGKSKPTEMDATAITDVTGEEVVRLRTEMERLKNAIAEREIIEDI